MPGKPGYSTANTPSKRTSLRWGDDCPNIVLAGPYLTAAATPSYSLGSSIVAKFVDTACQGIQSYIISRLMLY